MNNPYDVEEIRAKLLGAGHPDSKPDNIADLLMLAKRLTSLLEHPEPGLFMWRECLERVVEEIAHFGGYR